MDTETEIMHLRAHPDAFLEQAKRDGIGTLVFRDAAEAKSFFAQVKPMARWGKCKHLDCVVSIDENVVTAIADPALMGEVRYIKGAEK